jgi:hypothetical protein
MNNSNILKFPLSFRVAWPHLVAWRGSWVWKRREIVTCYYNAAAFLCLPLLESRSLAAVKAATSKHLINMFASNENLCYNSFIFFEMGWISYIGKRGIEDAHVRVLTSLYYKCLIYVDNMGWTLRRGNHGIEVACVVTYRPKPELLQIYTYTSQSVLT